MAYMSSQKRKEEFNWQCDHFRFETCYDLSKGVNVKPLYKNFKGDSKDMELFASDMACFMAYYMQNIYEELNGFSGFDTIKWSFLN